MCKGGESLSGNAKKCSTERSTSNDGAIYSAACRAQRNDGHTYNGVGKLNGWPVKVLQLTGCIRMMCVSSPIYSVIIGNVRGTRQMLPDSDWMSENLPGV